MCGRVVESTPPDRLADYFGAELAPGLVDRWAPSFNIGPTRDVLGLAVTRDGGRRISPYRWGLVPSWAKDPSIGSRLFNARADGIGTSNAFRSSFEAHRLAVLVDGYWEWKKAAGGRPSQPFYFHRPDGAPLALAGLSAYWRDPRGPRDAIHSSDPGAWLRSCTIITTDAPSDLAAVHARMPVVLPPEALDLWIDREHRDMEGLQALLVPVDEGVLDFYPVGQRVGDVRNDDAHLLDAIAPADDPPAHVQQSLL